MATLSSKKLELSCRSGAAYGRGLLQANGDNATAVRVATGPKTFKGLGGLFTFSSSKRKNLRVFFAPSLIDNDLPFNESLPFHESLHGFSGLGDGGVSGHIRLCDVLGATPQTKIKVEFPNCGSSTINVTDWIEEHIIAPH
jgi:hypothetical protein